MIQKMGMFLVAFLIFATSASAHIMNKDNVFNDLSLTEAADEVVLLSSLGIVSYLDGSFEFKPTAQLTAKDLAAWVAGYNGLEGASTDELARAAVKAELIATIDGDATYGLVNDVFFHGMLVLENAETTLTREEFAQFVVSHVNRDIGGHTLLEMSGYTPGPTGTIEHVNRVKKQTPSGSNAYVYLLTVDGTVYEVGMHLRVVANSTDPAVWVGQQIAESFNGPNVATDNAGKHLHHESHETYDDAVIAEEISETASEIVAAMAIQFLVVGDTAFTTLTEEIIVKNKPTEIATALAEVNETVEAKLETEAPSQTWKIISVLALICMAVVVFLMRKANKV